MGQLILPWPENSFWRKWMLRIVGLVIGAYLAYVVREIWLPLGLAFLLATVLDPVVDRMEQHGWRRGPAAAFIFFTFILIVVGMVVLAFPYLVNQIGTVEQSISKYFPDSSPHGLALAFARLKISPGVSRVLVEAVGSFQAGFLKSSGWITDYGMSFLGNMVWVVFVPIVGFYALRDYHLLLGKALLLAPKRHRDTVQVYVAEVSAVFARYLRGLGIVSLLNGLATWGLMEALRVPNALLLGLVAGILYSVPYIGAMITVAVTAAIAFVGGGLSLMYWSVGLSMVLHQLIFDQIITPRILGGQVGIHPIVSIVALLVGNLLCGIVGMVLAVPIAACIQIGVLALVPKLAVSLDTNGFSTRDGVEAIDRSETSKTEHLRIEDHKSLHGSVVQAADDVEAQLRADHAATELAGESI
jgi:predicted PurR-regulated permease PerM